MVRFVRLLRQISLYCMIKGIFMFLPCIDTVGMILSEWRDTVVHWSWIEQTFEKVGYRLVYV